MIPEQELRDYAAVVLEVGLGFPAGKDLAINAWVEHAPFARILADEAYRRGAELVDVWYWDAHVKKSRLLYAPESSLSRTPAMLDERYRDLMERRGALMNIVGDPDPDLLKDVDPKRAGLDRMPGLASRYEAQMSGKVEWNISAYPTDAWAQIVLGRPDAAALWEAMKPALRLDADDPVAAWKAHIALLKERAAGLNDARFDAIHYGGPGTNLTVGLPARHRWCYAETTTQNGIAQVVNLPTEEVYTAPDPKRADGVIRSTMPLALSGSLIEGLEFELKDGEIVRVDATSGAEIVRGYVAADEGARRLGELALVDKRSAVLKSGLIYYNTLFDENASCHIAFGSGIIQAHLDYDPMAPKTHEELGINHSATHIDFMVGSPEVTVSGVRADGSKQAIVANEEWQL
jgi:aminopeptidase